MIGPRRVDKPLVLYGYGKLGHLAEEVFKELKIPIAGIFDGATWLRPVSFKEEFIDRSDCLLAVCIASEPYQPIHDSLKADGWTDIVPVWDIIESYPEVGLGNGWFAGALSREDQDGIWFVRNRFSDGEMGHSEYHYLTFRDWYTTRREWVSALYPITSGGEGLPSTLADIRQRQRGDMFADVPMDSISIHNEGCELKTLEENIHLFRKYRPSLSVACYHSRDGLYEIQKTLMENLPDYIWTFRLHAFCGQAAYLYGVPREKK